MNIAIVGLGKMGLLHAGIFNSLKDVQITAIAEKEKLISNLIKKSSLDVQVYEKYESMLDSNNFDLVCITTPIATHLPIALSCIEKKINFFVEKPLVRNQTESRQLRNKLKDTQIFHTVGFNRRFMKTFSKAKSLLDSKILGDITRINSSVFVSNVFSKTAGWRLSKELSGGGVLLDLGCHLIDLLIWYFGSISSVKGGIRSIYSREVEDEATMELEFSNGIVANLKTSWSIRGYRLPETRLEIIGSNGKMIVCEDYVKISLLSPVPDLEKKDMTIFNQSLGNGVPIDIGGVDYTLEDTYIVDCIKNNKQSFINVFEASKTQSVIQAMYDSAKKNSVVIVNYE